MLRNAAEHPKVHKAAQGVRSARVRILAVGQDAWTNSPLCQPLAGGLGPHLAGLRALSLGLLSDSREAHEIKDSREQ